MKRIFSQMRNLRSVGSARRRCEMKANEFIKKFGWDAVINELKNTQDSVIVMWLGSQSNDYALVNDLKRLVESHKLVMQFGSLEEAKRNSENPNWLPDDNTGLLLELDIAIADVESCQ